MLRSQSSSEQGPRVVGWAKHLKTQKFQGGFYFRLPSVSSRAISLGRKPVIALKMFIYTRYHNNSGKCLFKSIKWGQKIIFFFIFFGTKARLTLINI